MVLFGIVQDAHELMALQSGNAILVQIPHITDVVPGLQYAIRVEAGQGLTAHTKRFAIA
jgi:hypothetical protein